MLQGHMGAITPKSGRILPNQYYIETVRMMGYNNEKLWNF
jgi:hypothetical protein